MLWNDRGLLVATSGFRRASTAASRLPCSRSAPAGLLTLPLLTLPLLTLLLLTGCGGNSPPAPNVPAGPQPPAVITTAAGQAKIAQPPVVKTQKKVPAKKVGGSGQLFPGEDPQNIFVVAADGTPMVVEPAPAARPDDYLEVLDGATDKHAGVLTVALAVAPASYPPREGFQLPKGFSAMASYGYSPEGLPWRIVCEKDQSVMALVPPGAAIIGTDDGPSEAAPQWSVFLDAYYMDVTEVTVAAFNTFRGEMKEQKKRVPLPPLNEAQGPNFPALGISWGDAHAYVEWLGKALPTEAEFEKAARGPEGFRAPWGNGRAIWPSHRTPATIAPVGAFPGDQSIFGIFDLAGNAREWTTDWYAPTAHQEAANLSQQRVLRNWTGPKKAAVGTQRVIKGSASDWSAWNRSGSDMSARNPDVGFRGVLRTPLPAS